MMDKRLTLTKFIMMLDRKTKVNVHIANYPYGEVRYIGDVKGYFDWKMSSSFWDAWVIKIGLNTSNELCIVAHSQDF